MKDRRCLTTNPFVSRQQQAACYAKQARGEADGWDCTEWSHASDQEALPETVSKPNVVRNAKGLNPLRLDPSRTLTLRKALARELAQRFRRLKLRIFALVVRENAFGLKDHLALSLTGNAYLTNVSLLGDPRTLSWEERNGIVSNADQDQPRDEHGRWVSLGWRSGENTPPQEVAERLLGAHASALQRFKDLGISTEGMRDIKIVTEEDASRGGAYATGTGLTHKHNEETEKQFEGVYASTKVERERGEVPGFAFQSMEDRMIHEIGHNIGRNLSEEDDRKLQRLYERYGGNADHLPSFYSQENSSEMWAESVLAVVKGYKFGGTYTGYGKQNPELERFVRSKLGLVTNENPRGCNQYTGPGCSSAMTQDPLPRSVRAAADLAAKIVAKGKATLDKVTGIPGILQVKDVLTRVAAGFHRTLSDRYGAKTAFAIVASAQGLAWGATAAGAITGVPIWLPGSTVWGSLPALALAETVLQAHRGIKAITGNRDEKGIHHHDPLMDDDEWETLRGDLSEKEVEREARRLLAGLRRALAKHLPKQDPTTNCAPGQMRGADGRCGPGISLGFRREHMPQVRGDDLPHLRDWLSVQGILTHKAEVPAGTLSPTQARFRQQRVDDLDDDALQAFVVVSSDDYILDGTHRWVKHWQRDPASLVPVIRIDLPVREAIDKLSDYPRASFTSNSNPEGCNQWTGPGCGVNSEKMAGENIDKALTAASKEDLPPGWVYDPRNLGGQTVASNRPGDGPVAVSDKFFAFKPGMSRDGIVFHELGHSIPAFSKENTKDTLDLLEPFKVGKEPRSVHTRYSHFGSSSGLPEEIVSDVYSQLMVIDREQKRQGIRSQWGSEEPEGKYGKFDLHVLMMARSVGLPTPGWYGSRTTSPTTNAPPTTGRWVSLPSSEKVKRFRSWLDDAVEEEILGTSEHDLFARYARQGFAKGAGRAFDDSNRRAGAKALSAPANPTGLSPDPLSMLAGGKQQFLQSAFARPVAGDKIRLLADRAYSDLEGVTEQMATSMTRSLMDGLAQGKSPLAIAKDLNDDVDGIGIVRATTIARTEVVRAHADGQLLALAELGVAELGVDVEWTATEGACELCSANDGVVFSLEEAQGLIPHHPNCRCCWIPAFDDLEAPTKNKRVLNVFCPTGVGGGVDATCSPSQAKGEDSPQVGELGHDPHAEAVRQRVLAAGDAMNATRVHLADLKDEQAQLVAGYRRGEVSELKMRAKGIEVSAALEDYHEARERDLMDVVMALRPERVGPQVEHLWAGTDKPTKDMVTAVRDGSTFVKVMLGQREDEFLPDLSVQHRRSDVFGRPSCYDGRDAGEGRAVIHHVKGVSDYPEVTVHELGHALEHHLPGAREACNAFLDRRLKGEVEVDLSERFPGQGYDKSDTGAKDRFDKVVDDDPSGAYYVGKRYKDGATEVLSMGLQYLHRDPAKFARRDPEWFRLVVGIMHGSGR